MHDVEISLCNIKKKKKRKHVTLSTLPELIVRPRWLHSTPSLFKCREDEIKILVWESKSSSLASKREPSMGQ